jgi:Ca-activated chloride channel family protein
MSFDLPLLLWSAPGLVLALGATAWWARHRRVRAGAAWSPALGATAARGRWSPVVVALGAGLLGVGIAGPRWGSADVDTETRALNVVFAIDVSKSMLAEDVVPNRLAHSIRESRRLLQDARGDRMALVAFAGRSYILTPLTLDDAAVELQLDALDPGIASEGGTELAPVLRQGRELLQAVTEGGARAMVLFTDGEAHDSLDAIREAARSLRDGGVTLIVVGQGGLAPARIPIRNETGVLVEYHKDGAGAQVSTQRHDEVLRAVADAGQGILVPADFPDQAGAVWRTLASLDRDPATGRRTEDLVPRAWWFAVAAFLLLLVQAAARRRAALVALAGLTLLGSPARAQRPAPGLARLKARDTARAIDAFRQAAEVGRGRDTSWYNSGTVAVAAGQLDLARPALGNAATSLDPGLRFQALYNLGLVAFQEARADTSRREALEREAAQRFREALTLEPGSAAAKWNLELVSRRRPPPPSSSGQSNAPPQPRSRSPNAPPQPGALSPAEAEQILRSMERAEQAVRADQVRRRRVARSASYKDW